MNDIEIDLKLLAAELVRMDSPYRIAATWLNEETGHTLAMSVRPMERWALLLALSQEERVQSFRVLLERRLQQSLEAGA